MKHAFGVGKPNPADAHKYAQGTGGVSDYDKGMAHALGGRGKPNPNVTSEENDSRRDYYNEQIKRAADDYLNEFGGRDDEETKQAFAAYGKQVDGLVEQRDAYNRAAMGVDTTETLNSRPDAFAAHDIPKDSARPDAFAAHNIPKSEDELSPLKPQDVTRSSMYNTVDMNQDDAINGNKEQMTSGGQPTQSYMDDTFGAGGAWEPSEVQSEALYNSHLNLIKARTVLQKYENVSEYMASIDITKMDAEEANEVAELGNTMLEEVREETGYTYDEAVENIKQYEGDIEGIKIELEVVERIGELDENPDISVFDWEGSGLDIKEQLDGCQGELEQLTTEYDELLAEYYTLSDDEQLVMGNEINELKIEINNMETLISDTNTALDYDNDIEDLNMTQLVLRAQDMFFNQTNGIANDSISSSNAGFNRALESWKEGDDEAMQLIVYLTYFGEKDLDDIEDFNALREGYCLLNYPFTELGEAQNLLTRTESEIIDIIEPYFIKAVNYEKTDAGFTITVPTNLLFAMDYAKRKEFEYNSAGETTDYATIAGSTVAGLVPVYGDMAALGISLFGKILSDHYGVKEDMWDDAMVIYDALDYAEPTDEPFITLEWNEEKGDFDILEE